MSDNKNNGSGFFWGLMIGAAAGSLLSTKKGRQILKDLADHGLDSLENVVNLEEIRNAMDDEEPVDVETKDAASDELPPVKKKPRLFKGLRKR